MKLVVSCIVLILLSGGLAAQNKLEEQLEALNIPSNQLPDVVSREKIYAIQTRHNDLNKKHEWFIGGGNQILGSGHLSHRRFGMNYSYNFNPKWALRINAAKAFNDLNDSGKLLLERQELLPDKDFSKQVFDVQTSYNAFYGKFRLSMDRTFYFDQYVSLGAGVVDLHSGRVPMLTGDIGLTLWMRKNLPIRLGLRSELYREKRVTGEASNYNVIAHIDIGHLFGQN